MKRYITNVLLLSLMATIASAQTPATRPANATDAPEASSQRLPELRPILTPEMKRERAQEIIDRFVARLADAPWFERSAVDAVRKGWETHREAEDLQDLRDFLTAALAMLSEPFKESLDALDQENYSAADVRLRQLSGHEDPWLSLHAQAFLARSLVEQERLEEAERVLAPLADRERELMTMSFLETEVDFFLAYALLANLHYDRAVEALRAFERQHPDAPDMFRLPAMQMLQELGNRSPESLGEVSDLMVYAGRRLRLGEPGKPVQIRQDRAIEILNKLIEEAEQQEQQQGGGGGGGGQGSQNQQQGGGGSAGGPAGGAQRSTLPPGQGEPGELHRSPRARPGEQWGNMPPEEREKILQSLRESFPSRYRQLVEQYYKQLAKEQ